MKNITDLLIDKIETMNNPTVAGLDPRLEFLPDDLRKTATDAQSSAKAVAEFNCSIIDAIKDIVPAVKIQSAFYELFSHYGVRAMDETARYAKDSGLIVRRRKPTPPHTSTADCTIISPSILMRALTE